MNILVIDAQGGGVGKQLVAALKKALPRAEVAAVGTNSAATTAMLRAGAAPYRRYLRRKRLAVVVTAAVVLAARHSVCLYGDNCLCYNNHSLQS